MKRRVLIKRLGIAGGTALGAAGTTSASTVPPEFGVEGEVDVSDIDGQVPLADLLDDDQLDEFNDDLDPGEVKLTIKPEAETFDVGTDCHTRHWSCTTCCGSDTGCTVGCVTCCCWNCETE